MLSQMLEQKLIAFAQTLVDQQAARVIVPPQQPKTGYWFGGGNMRQSEDGTLYVVGRYRNYGDSRTGVGAGERGLELAIFRSRDQGRTFEKTVGWSKEELDIGDWRVLSIEGAALWFGEHEVELFVSTEKTGLGYPAGFEEYLKPGAGVWTIERLAARNLEALKSATLQTIVQSSDPNHVHCKDPFVAMVNDRFHLLYCTHPFGWSSSNTAFVVRDEAGNFSPPTTDFFPRGVSWDVAMTRGTCLLDVPQVGAFKDLSVTLVFYDGGESLRNLDEHAQAKKRPRGYSCEELGGVAYFVDGDLSRITRLSRYFPMFTSPYGTACSRYVDVLATDHAFHVTWQQSQEDLSQPLVMNHVSRDQAESVLR